MSLPTGTPHVVGRRSLTAEMSPERARFVDLQERLLTHYGVHASSRYLGHFPFLEAPQRCAELMLAFLAGNASTTTKGSLR
jgi:hypothetical protein